MAESKTTTSGIGFTGLLAPLFITLKLIGEHFHTPVADWSWWWVLSPIWIPLVIVLALLVFAGIVAAI